MTCPWPCGAAPLTTVTPPVGADAHDRALERHGGGRLDVVDEADPEVAPLGAQPRLLAPRRGEVEGLEREIHAARIVAGVVLDRPAPRGGEAGRVRMPVGGDEVPPPDLDGVDAETAGQRVHRALDDARCRTGGPRRGRRRPASSW